MGADRQPAPGTYFPERRKSSKAIGSASQLQCPLGPSSGGGGGRKGWGSCVRERDPTEMCQEGEHTSQLKDTLSPALQEL